MDHEQALAARFNGLSRGDRLKLRCAAFSDVVGAAIQTSVRDRPWLYPLYLCFLGPMFMPYSGGLATANFLLGLCAVRFLPCFSATRESLRSAFREAALADVYADFIMPGLDPSRPSRLRSWSLAWYMARQAGRNLRQATHIFTAAMKGRSTDKKLAP